MNLTDFVHITAADDSRIAPFRSLKQRSDRLSARSEIIVEGPQAVRRLLRSSLTITALLIEEKYFPEISADLPAFPKTGMPCEWLVAERSVLNELVGFRLHQGILASARRPAPIALNNLQLPAIALDGLLDAENVGAIVRTAAAFGIRSFLVDETSADPYLRRAVRVSMGAALFADVCYVGDIASALRGLKERGTICCLELTDRAVPLSSADFARDTVLVFGSEGKGISAGVLACADQIFAIEMLTDAAESLNVHAAAAIALHAYKKQHS